MSVDVEVRREGRRFDAQARLLLKAPAALVWRTITDYDALPSFMPGIRACRVLSRQHTADGEQLSVEQQGEFRFLLFAQSMQVSLDIAHAGERVAHARATRFDVGPLKTRALDRFEGRYEITAVRDREVELHYTALIALRLPPPPGIGNVAVRQNLAAQLEAVAAEVARRAAGRAARPGKG